MLNFNWPATKYLLVSDAARQRWNLWKFIKLRPTNYANPVSLASTFDEGLTSKYGTLVASFSLHVLLSSEQLELYFRRRDETTKWQRPVLTLASTIRWFSLDHTL